MSARRRLERQGEQMTRRAMSARVPGLRRTLTPAQRRAIFYHFGRLGFDAADRDERLEAASGLLGLNYELRSINTLSLGQAGKLISILERTRITAEPLIDAGLADPDHVPPVEADDQGDDPASLMLGEVIVMAAAAVYLAWAARHPKENR
jgi:hypothetical protein